MTDEARVIVLTVASSWGLTDEALYGRDRSKTVSSARKEAMRQVRLLLGFSYPEIGRMFGRHHTSVMYACSGKRRTAKKKRAAKAPHKSYYWAASSR